MDENPMGRRRPRFAVGYALASKKQASFVQISLINLAKEKGIDLIKIDLQKPLIEQGPFDLVLHKIYGPEWRQRLAEYSEKYPDVLIIDSPGAIERLHNRVSMLQVVTELNVVESEAASFGIPNQIAVYDAKGVEGMDLEEKGLKFPVIAKPLVADGSAKSHKMSLVYDKDGLSKLKPPIVLQEFVNHGGVIFKVYVVGDFVKCVKRKSLSDVDEESLENLKGSLSFSQVSNMSSVERNGDSYYRMMELEDGKMENPPMSFLVDISKGLKRVMGLHLFNFDVIRDIRVGNRYLVVDINYFPGYAKMPGYEHVLTDFFLNVLSSRNNDKKECESLDDSKRECGNLDDLTKGNCEKEVKILDDLKKGSCDLDDLTKGSSEKEVKMLVMNAQCNEDDGAVLNLPI